MDVSTIITLVTIVITFICGLIAKRIEWVNNRLIPIQNLLIGLISAGVYYYFTKDLNLAIALVGLGTGGAYDVVHNLQKILKKEGN